MELTITEQNQNNKMNCDLKGWKQAFAERDWRAGNRDERPSTTEQTSED